MSAYHFQFPVHRRFPPFALNEDVCREFISECVNIADLQNHDSHEHNNLQREFESERVM